jgi:CRP-like cAMP-binding protein
MQQFSDITLNGLSDLFPNSFAADGDGSQCRNLLLAALAPEALERVAPHLHPMELISGDVLQESGAPIEQVYFVEEGLVSQVTDSEDGGQVEVALTGKEGLAGALVCLGHHPALHKTMVQVPGRAYRLSVEVLEEESLRNPQWHQLLLHYVYALFAQSSRSVLCNRTHTLEERLSRWLLLVRDRIQSDTLPLRDEFIAHMLGVRRSSVTVGLGVLQQAGLIDNTRGDILILSNEKLERTSCPCYRNIQNQFQRFEDAAKNSIA